jgi:hypothetical protein
LSLILQNSRDLITSGKFKLKVLCIGSPGVGKTSWTATAPGVGVAACETGWGSGLLSSAMKNVDFVEPSNLAEMEAVAKGQVFAKNPTIAIDSLSAMARTFIKDHALTFARRGPDSPKRKSGVPELDDYGTIGELTRRLLAQTLDQDKHVIVTCTERYEKDENGVIMRIGPDLAGQMFAGAPAMFDFVFYFKTRKKLRTPGVKASEYVEHYFITQNDGMHLGKCRSVVDDAALLPPEVIVDLKSGAGCFSDVLKTIEDGYAKVTK